MQKSECTLAIEGFISAEPNRLRPLPAACTLEDARALLQPTKANGPAYLGDANRVTLHNFRSDKFKVVRVWVDQTGHVIYIDADYAPAPQEQYFEALGKPDFDLDFPWGQTVVPGGEHVWLQRGATIVYKQDYTKDVIHVGIFRAGLTREEYEKTVRFTAESDEEPESSED